MSVELGLLLVGVAFCIYELRALNKKQKGLVAFLLGGLALVAYRLGRGRSPKKEVDKIVEELELEIEEIENVDHGPSDKPSTITIERIGRLRQGPDK